MVVRIIPKWNDLDNEMHEKFAAYTSHIYNRLFLSGEDCFETRRITSICKLFRRYQNLLEKF